MSFISFDAGSLPYVLASQASDPALLRTHLGFYRQLMFAPGPLTRVERELVAVVVSAENRCHY